MNFEAKFPVEKLNPVALGEGNSKKPIYRMHKWWARRLGSVFRAIILTVFSTEQDSAESIWRKFCEGTNLPKGRIVLDPFMGGGTTIVEAVRLGCKVVGVDINPVAWFITKKEIEPVDIRELETAFHNLEETVGNQIKHYYRTTDPQGNKAEVMYYFWVKTAQCGKCGTTIRLFPNYELSRRGNVYTSVCPHCFAINETKGLISETKCIDCGIAYNPRVGVSKRGIFKCTNCGEEQKLLDVIKRKGTALDLELYALEGFSKEYGRFFKRIDQEDIALWEEAKTKFESMKPHLLYPTQPIPTKGRSDPRPVNHGYTHFYQMFNERQLLCLSLLYQAIMGIENQNIRELMQLAFSDSLNTNNMFCKYETNWHKISLFFSLHAFHPIERPTENNVWGTKFGRGTFVKCYEKIRSAKTYANKPYERLLNAKRERYSHYVQNENIEAQVVNSFDELLATDRAAMLQCHNSEDLSFIPNQSVDAVITDPPYFDNVQYSELADFFYVWLRLGLQKNYPWFEPETSANPDELVKNDNLGKTMEFFNSGLERVFSECHRVLKHDGLLVFSFHHTKSWAWESLAKILLESGFYIAEMSLVWSEGRGEVHNSKGNIRYDCILICRKKPAPTTKINWELLSESIITDTKTWVQRILDSNMKMNDVDISTVLKGKTIEYYTKAMASRNFNNNLPTLTDALEEMTNMVSAIRSTISKQRDSKDATHFGQLRLFSLELKNS